MGHLDTNRDLASLHPNMRARVVRVMEAVEAEGLPLRVFEAWRAPERQRHLFEQGRTRPGAVVTFARPWESYHQHGLAVDIVGHVDGKFTWELPDATWRRLHQIGAAHGLERLGFETPHLQLAGLRIAELMEGDWPDGGDASWHAMLGDAIGRWDGRPAAPPLDLAVPPRPSLRGQSSAPALDWFGTPSPDEAGWHNQFGGQEWRYDKAGVYLRADPDTPVRSPGAPTTCSMILDLFGPAIHAAAMDHAVPPELIVMTIATETAFARNEGFTGPRTFRWEGHVEVRDVQPPAFGDYSAGPMQALAGTARDVIRRLGLRYPDPFAIAPHIEDKPGANPASHPLYAAGPNVDIGTAEMRSRLNLTGLDPILVSAAYNAGGLRQTELNAWRLRSSHDHLDRAAQWFGDACFVLSGLR